MKQSYDGVQPSIDGPRHCYTFSRHTSYTPPSSSSSQVAAAAPTGSAVPGGSDADGPGAGLLSCPFGPGDMALLGVEGRHPVLARVTIGEVTKDSMQVLCKREIRLDKLASLPGADGTGQHAALAPAAAATGPVPLWGACSSAAGHPHPRAAAVPGTAPIPGPSNDTRPVDREAQPVAGARSMQSVQSVALLRPLSWRLDKDEASSTFNLMRSNLLALMAPHGPAVRLRQLLVDLEPPQQGQLVGTAASQASLGYLTQAQDNPDLNLNPDQHEAVSRVLQMRDYALVLGMPGTGKTTTIVHIIKALLLAGCSILITSYTNSAVDNILLKLIEEQTRAQQQQVSQPAGTGVGGRSGHGVDLTFLRLGNPQAVHAAVRPYLPGGERHPVASAADLSRLASRSRLVASTCLSCRNPLLSRRTFDVALVDEASQISLPAVLGPLVLARSFLLVGDHYQLSPLVTSKHAAEGGLATSLFRRLSEAAPQAVITLRRQYRMASDIMSLSNALVYSGAMKCGSGAIAHAKLVLPRYPSASAQGAEWPVWLLQALHPERRVVFLDTSGVAGCSEQLLGDGVSNPGEAALVGALLRGLLSAGAAASDIGLTSPYKAQVAALVREAAAALRQQQQQQQRAPAATAAAPAAAKSEEAARIEALTIDKYQGRDKPVVVLSLVRSNVHGNTGRLLADWQRINVALTRAKTKLLMVGCASTLRGVPLLASLLDVVEGRGWRLQLPHDCVSLPAAATGG